MTNLRPHEYTTSAALATCLPLHRSASPTVRIAAVFFRLLGLRRWCRTVATLCFANCCRPPPSPSDEILSCYTTTIPKRVLRFTAEYLRVRNGIVYIQDLRSSDTFNSPIRTSFVAIDGVRKVVSTGRARCRQHPNHRLLPPRSMAFCPATCSSPRSWPIPAGRIFP